MKFPTLGLFKSKVPSRARTLKELRKFLPGAEVHNHTENGATGVLLDYAVSLRTAQGKTITERAPVLQVMNGVRPDGSRVALSSDQLAYACLVGASRRFGFDTIYTPGFPSGKFAYVPIKGFGGIPKGLEGKSGKELADAMNARVRAREAEIATEIATDGKCNGSCDDSLECEGCPPEKVAEIYKVATTPAVPKKDKDYE